MNPFLKAMEQVIVALTAIEKFHNGIPLGYPLMSHGVQIDCTELNKAYSAAEYALQLIAKMK